ncbi:MAG: ABC transporter permease [Ruminococcaceae bacterium]|nr:ABC transporter permease [Oscillospiraceae bacterium]
MKLRSVSYLSKEGVKNMWANRLMTVASVGVLVACMVLIGLAILVSLNLNVAIGNLEKQNVIRVFFNDKTSVIYGNASEKYNPENSQSTSSNEDNKIDFDAIPEDAYLIHNEEEAKALCDRLAKIDNVANVEYVSAEDALKEVKESGQLPEGSAEYFDFDDEYGNPISCGAIVTLEDMSVFSETLKTIESVKGVDATQSHADIANKINAIKNGVTIAGVWIIAILLIISLVIVSNTIRVTMYSRKLEISIMKAVGATNSFIRLPFIIEGVMIGLVSAVISMGILYFCYRVAIEAICSALGNMEAISFLSVFPLILGVFAIIGVLSGVVGSVIMIRKYLKKEGSEFTAI